MTYRNPALLALANGAPCCAPGCGRNDGTTVAAHANEQSYGKGTGIKAADWAMAFLCHGCHVDLDADDRMNREDKREFFHRAALRTYGHLLESGKLTVAR